MNSKASEKIIDALTQLMEGYIELQESIEEEYGSSSMTDDDDDESSVSEEVDAAIVTEIRAALEAVMESEDYSPEELASVISTMTDAIEEIAPDVFEEDEEEDDDDEDYEDYDDDDEDLDLDEEEDEEDDD